MQPDEALDLAQRCAPRFAQAGLPAAPTITKVRAKRMCGLWAGMGAVYELVVSADGIPDFAIVAKRISLPKNCSSIGDRRKKDSYDCEAAFYACGGGFAERLIKAGAAVPFPLLVERTPALTICMTKLVGRSGSMHGEQTAAALSWLAKLHASTWGAARADAAVAGGLQAQGTYWYLDTRPDELAAMPHRGWEGRLRLAARALDERLKAGALQCVVHGDAKDANMLFASDGAALLYDFQYCGKAPPTKDLAYALTCASNAPEQEARLLEGYHAELSALLRASGDAPPGLSQIQASLGLALADLGRWMSGWGWWGHDLSHRIKPLLDTLDGGTPLASEEAYREAVWRVYPEGAV